MDVKLIGLVIFFTVTSSVNGFSQVSFGVKGGVNIASLVGDGVDNLNIRTSVHFAGIVEIELSDKFSIQPEIMFSAQGAKQSINDYEASWFLNYINIPLLGKYYINDKLSLEAGPQIGFLMNAKLDWKNDEESGLDDLDEITSSIDFGIDFGLGYKLESGLNFGARYNVGLSDVVDDFEDNGSTVKNGVFQISVGYFFN